MAMAIPASQLFIPFISFAPVALAVPASLVSRPLIAGVVRL
jgi:hypothetical protein